VSNLAANAVFGPASHRADVLLRPARSRRLFTAKNAKSAKNGRRIHVNLASPLRVLRAFAVPLSSGRCTEVES